jgi:calcineurin-like phosphoesterase family protein
MAIYFCSDPHAFHGNIMKYSRRLKFMTTAERMLYLELEQRADLDPRYRFKSLKISTESVDNMNWGLVDAINSRVAFNGELWCLGDWAFGKDKDYLKNCCWFRDQIRCRTVNLIFGNHDQENKSFRDLFSRTAHRVELDLERAILVLDHFPMVTWNRRFHGTPERPVVHLYGHVHGVHEAHHPIARPDLWAALDVGFDAHGYQVLSLDEALAILAPKVLAFHENKHKVETGA